MKRACLLALSIAVVYGVSEHLYYYPLTPLSLDLRGKTRLPRAPQKIRLLFAGDTLLGDWAQRTIRHLGHDYPFLATRSLVRSADLAVANLEGPISASGRREAKRWSYRMGPTAALALRQAGFDAVSLANNHIRDCGNVGVRESIALLRAAGVVPFGAGVDETSAHRPAIVEARGVKVALVGFVAPRIETDSGNISMRHAGWGPGQAGAAWGEPERLIRDVRRALPRAHLTIVSIHMGDRYQEEPTEFERQLSRSAIDAGAAAVIGHGPHILGPVEIHRGRPIFYSVGNYAFGSVNAHARFSLLAFLEIDRQSRRVVALQALPIYTMNANPWIDFQPKVIQGLQARRVLEELIHGSGAGAPGLRLERKPDRLVARLSY